MNDAQTPNPEVPDVAPLVYVREVMAEDIRDEVADSGIDLPADATLYAVHTEDGVCRAIFSDRDAAFEAAVSHGAQPVSVH